MATGTGVNQGKSAFLKKFLDSNSDSKLESINKAWNAAGNEGTISLSLLKSVRSELGLTNKRTAKVEATRKTAGPMAKSKPTKGAITKPESKPEKVQSQPKASKGDSGSGKSAFVKEVLGREPKSNVKAVNEEWLAAGNQGTISDSIYYKIKREVVESDEDISSSPEQPKQVSASSGPATRTKVEARSESSGETIPSSPSRSESRDREQVLDRVEDGIDDLIDELKRLGGMEVALESLKKVRRVVVRSHQG